MDAITAVRPGQAAAVFLQTSRGSLKAWYFSCAILAAQSSDFYLAPKRMNLCQPVLFLLIFGSFGSSPVALQVPCLVQKFSQASH